MLFSKPQVPELLSLHIPKTAGTSFRNILKTAYGENQVVRFDINEKGVVKMNEKIYDHKDLPSVKVIHGHFAYRDLQKKFKLPENVKLITWMRDPVQRVISNFYYLESRLMELLDEERNDLNILSKMQRTLLEYARAEINRNRQSKFLAEVNLSKFDFVGITEHFSEDILRLSKTLNWNRTPEVLHHNKTLNTKKTVEQDVIEEIRSLNMQDVNLYQEAVQIRNSIMKA
jgi:hypothetical protein